MTDSDYLMCELCCSTVHYTLPRGMIHVELDTWYKEP